VVNHEHFEELCAAASAGHATPDELFELEQHAANCQACQKAYWDYLNLDALHVVERESSPPLSPREAQESLNSDLVVRRFFERAEKEGIVFSRDVGTEARKLAPPADRLRSQPWWPKPALAFAATLTIATTVAAAYFFGKRSSQSAPLASQQVVPATPTSTLDSSLQQRVTELTDTISKLQAETDRLKIELKNADDELGKTRTDLNANARDRERLAATRSELETRITAAEQNLAQAQSLITNAQQDAAKQRQRASDIEATLVADKVKISDLTGELSQKSTMLDQERQLLALGHDVNDLMGARNLHIVDVVDTDPKGKTGPAFGRVFFTEGKSLIFYAYDLNEAKLQKTDFEYRVWARQEGGDNKVRSMGIFYSDDKAQRRWVYKCNDPKILNEIDSVFVTLEPSGNDANRPKGQNLLYAYLRGQPKHP
jgi:hypothetical protein